MENPRGDQEGEGIGEHDRHLPEHLVRGEKEGTMLVINDVVEAICRDGWWGGKGGQGDGA